MVYSYKRTPPAITTMFYFETHLGRLAIWIAFHNNGLQSIARRYRGKDILCAVAVRQSVL